MNTIKTTEEQIKEVIGSIDAMLAEAKEEMKLFADSEVMFLKWLKENKINIFSHIANDGKCTFLIQHDYTLTKLYHQGSCSKEGSHLNRLICKYFLYGNGKIKAFLNEKLGEIVFTQGLELL